MNWQGKSVLVTGAGGFIGSHLCEALITRGANVRALVHYNSLGRWGWLDSSDLKDEMDVLAGDIADRDSVKQAMSGVDTVFHLAALIAIPYSYAAPASYVNSNVVGTLNVVQAARELEISKVVHTSTSEVYGTALTVPISEEHPLQGQSPYSASKIGADKIAESFHLSFNVPIVTVRPFNTFGPRQSSRAVIPTIISQCVANVDSIKLGSLTPTRDMNFVSNTVDGFMSAAVSSKAVGRTINLGSGREISIGDLAKLIMKQCKVDIPIKCEEQRQRPQNSEVNRLLADNSLAKELLNWTPSVSLEDGLSKTIDWVRHNIESFRVGQYTV